MKELSPQFEDEYERLKQLLAGKNELLVVIHSNPDPDALASAYVLGFIAEKLSGIKTSIAYSGDIGRIENKVMVRELGIRLKQLSKIKFSKYDLVAMVDTQPHAGNNEMPRTRKIHIVMDHHPRRRDTIADLVFIHPDLGATATILVYWLRLGNWPIPSYVATALAYAISSETQNMYREASVTDIEAYAYIYAKSSIRKLAQITNPRLPHFYYLMLVKALNNTLVYRNLMVCHLGEIASPEFVAEIADLLIRHRNISWSFCTGYKKGMLHLSLRSKNRNANAGRVIKKLVKEVDNAGGHDLAAGGFIRLENTKKEFLYPLFQKISMLLAVQLGYNPENIKWKPLIDDTITEYQGVLKKPEE
jgi:nanoRNase/pAp phosphatase (c-di-AMP/oligoRNAs hydrolase)